MMDGACVRVCVGARARARKQGGATAAILVQTKPASGETREHGGCVEADGRGAPVTEVELVSDALLIGIWLHFRLLGGYFDSRLPFASSVASAKRSGSLWRGHVGGAALPRGRGRC